MVDVEVAPVAGDVAAETVGEPPGAAVAPVAGSNTNECFRRPCASDSKIGMLPSSTGSLAWRPPGISMH